MQAPLTVSRSSAGCQAWPKIVKCQAWLAAAGNYDTYIRTRREQEENQMKKYKWEQEQIKDMKEYIARFGHGSAKLARQAQSKEKTLEKMVGAPSAVCGGGSDCHWTT